MAAITNTQAAFMGCSNLERIYTDANFDSTTSFNNMFAGCDKLTGGQGTKWGTKYSGKDLANIDTCDDSSAKPWDEYNAKVPGVLTLKNEAVGHRYFNLIGNVSTRVKWELLSKEMERLNQVCNVMDLTLYY